MKKNGESIYGTQASPLAATPWGRCTRKTTRRRPTRLYLHVFNWPHDGKLTVADVPGVPEGAYNCSTAARNWISRRKAIPR